MTTVDTRMMKAMAHPLRQRILTALNARVASPSELADEFDEPLGNVSYHVRMLVDLECIELVATTPRRGALEHHYKAITSPTFDVDSWKALPTNVRGSLAGNLLTQIGLDVTAAVGNGGLDTGIITRLPLTLDEKGEEALDALLGKTLERALEIAGASQKRLAKSKTGGQERTLNVLSFRA